MLKQGGIRINAELNLYEILLEYKESESNFEEILKIFQPLILKYVKLLNYHDKDELHSELVFFLYLLLPKIPLLQEEFSESKYILSYVKKSFRNEYVRLNKKYEYEEFFCSYDVGMEIGYENDSGIDEIICYIKKFLSESEFNLFLLRFIYKMNYREIGDFLDISPQGSHKKVINLRNKLKIILKDYK